MEQHLLAIALEEKMHQIPTPFFHRIRAWIDTKTGKKTTHNRPRAAYGWVAFALRGKICHNRKHLGEQETGMLLPLPKNARSALIVVDMQVFFFQKPDRRQGLEQVVENINRLIDCFDARSFPVFHVTSGYKADQSDWDLKMKSAGVPELIEGTPETAILPQINVSRHHTKVVKTRYSAFFNTPLAELLKAQKIKRVVVTGGYTHYCVNATIFDAYGYDFVPCLITDAVISHLKDEAELMIRRMRRNGYHVFSTAELITEIEHS